MGIVFDKVTPEEVGLHSEDIRAFLDEMEENQICLHGFVLLRHGKLAAEGYWKPMTGETTHRMYSATKTFVGAAIGLLADEGKITLDDPIVQYFPDLLPEKGAHPYLAKTTIRNLLMMSTCYSKSTYWIENEDWLASYFYSQPDHPSGTLFHYDSCGSYVLGALVKRVTGKNFVEYLKEKVLLKLGFAPERRCLLGPDGELWAGSGLLITVRELAAFAQLLLDGGTFRGEQLISEQYVRNMTSRQIDNRTDGSNYSGHCGYGYQTWILKDDAFWLNGAGSQMAVGFPHTGLLFACTADTQGNPQGNHQIHDALWRHIACKLEGTLPANPVEHDKLLKRCEDLVIPAIEGQKDSVFRNKVAGKTYKLFPNAMGIQEIKLSWEGDRGILQYTNPRGKKTLSFGMKHYVEGTFPETHYPGEKLKVPAGREYACACCGAWAQEHLLVIRILILDDFIGNMTMAFSFKGDEVGVEMHKNAQFFLDEYEGYAGGHL